VHNNKSKMSQPFGFLGMDFDDIRRKKEKCILEVSNANRLTWETALSAVSRFSEGRACSKGKGTKQESENFPPESRREGSFNICYWVNIEGIDTQWVVRFPKPIADHSIIRMKLRSEVATLQFLHQSTRVPVPKVIGYGEGDDAFPPFLIMENVDGIRLTLLWGVNVGPSIVTRILRSIAEVHHELLSHPFDRIGMLDLPTSNDAPPVLISPLSLDTLEHCRDGVSPTLHPPFETVSQYYDHKLGIWNHRLREQRNSVDSRTDALRKFINAEIIREFLDHSDSPLQENGPFYLVHPDMGGNNVIIDPQSWKIKAIIDWEGTCILPVESALSPPKCLHNIKPIDLLPDSNEYQRFQERLKLYCRQFSHVIGMLSDAKRDMDNANIKVVKQNEWPMSASLIPRHFCIWAIDDVRDLDQLVWQHIAPALYIELQKEYHTILSRQPVDESDETSHDTIQSLLNNFINKLYSSGQYDVDTINFWVDKKLKDLEAYQHECEVSSLDDK
jgi:hypothetical protein